MQLKRQLTPLSLRILIGVWSALRIKLSALGAMNSSEKSSRDCKIIITVSRKKCSIWERTKRSIWAIWVLTPWTAWKSWKVINTSARKYLKRLNSVASWRLKKKKSCLSTSQTLILRMSPISISKRFLVLIRTMPLANSRCWTTSTRDTIRCILTSWRLRSKRQRLRKKTNFSRTCSSNTLTVSRLTTMLWMRTILFS